MPDSLVTIQGDAKKKSNTWTIESELVIWLMIMSLWIIRRGDKIIEINKEEKPLKNECRGSICMSLLPEGRRIGIELEKEKFEQRPLACKTLLGHMITGRIHSEDKLNQLIWTNQL